MKAMPIRWTLSRMVRAGRPPQAGGRGATPVAREHAVKTDALPLRIAMAMLVVAVAAGCQERLAQRDAYFAPLSGLSTSLHAETEHALDYHQTLQAALLGCGERQDRAASPGGSGSASAVLEGTGDRETHARLCASSGMTHAAHGAPLNGYRRWVQDAVRPLPAPSETASSIGGGS